ncbi:EVE domain-containing protein [Mycobacterium sp. IS-1742]|uniref:EVE domain-containing protein n=1 Tax=Mycobacterium sp. IS-1742 TaxID=1772285 RepID=UPI000740528B|nr:EVE domain-containing protein [Mycobacterium sp. IS-1742]KUI26362.1 EVE domain-containing protein [Mycobacterium sp. IS-1742]
MTNWIITVSRDHVERAVRGRFLQANHGRPHALRRMSLGDWVIFYSPRVTHPDGAPLQAFTALGRVVDEEPYRASTEGEVWRRNVDFLDCVETPIRPLIDALDFVENKQRWGYKFRFGVFRIDDHDFETIRTAMTHSSDLVGASTVNDDAGGVPALDSSTVQ